MQFDSDALVDEYLASHRKVAKTHGAAEVTIGAGQAKGILSDVITRLRALNINWTVILQHVGTILAMIFQGTPVGAIIAAILALINPPTPAAA